MADADALQEHYQSLNDDALSQAYAKGQDSYEPLEWSIVFSELQRRGLSGPDSPVVVEYAPPWNRVVGQFVDAIIALAPGFVIAWLPLGDSALVVLAVSWVAWSFFYLLLADGLQGGQSLGKRLAQTRVIDAVTGAPCTYLQSLGRNLTLLLLGPIDWIWILGERRQRLGDRMVGTIVIPAGRQVEFASAVAEEL